MLENAVEKTGNFTWPIHGLKEIVKFDVTPLAVKKSALQTIGCFLVKNQREFFRKF